MDEKLIKQWKLLYGNIYKVKISDQEYIYRTLSVKEYSEILPLIDSDDESAIEEIALSAVLYPEINDTSVGLSAKLTELIINASKIFTEQGFKDLVLKARENVSKFYKNDLSSWKLILINVFPSYSLEYIDSLSIQELFNKIILVEKITGKSIIVLPGEQKTRPKRRREMTELDEDKMLMNKATTNDKRASDEAAAEEAAETLRQHYLINKNKGK